MRHGGGYLAEIESVQRHTVQQRLPRRMLPRNLEITTRLRFLNYADKQWSEEPQLGTEWRKGHRKCIGSRRLHWDLVLRFYEQYRGASCFRIIRCEHQTVDGTKHPATRVKAQPPVFLAAMPRAERFCRLFGTIARTACLEAMAGMIDHRRIVWEFNSAIFRSFCGCAGKQS